MVITNRVLCGGATHWTARKEQQTCKIYQKWFKGEGLPLVAMQKMVLAPYTFFLAAEAGIQICTDSLSFCLTIMLIQFRRLLSALWYEFQLVGLLSEFVLHKVHCCLLILSGTEKMVWDLKGYNYCHYWWTTFVWTIIRYMGEKFQKPWRWHNQSFIYAVPANQIVQTKWNLISVEKLCTSICHFIPGCWVILFKRNIDSGRNLAH